VFVDIIPQAEFTAIWPPMQNICRIQAAAVSAFHIKENTAAVLSPSSGIAIGK